MARERILIDASFLVGLYDSLSKEHLQIVEMSRQARFQMFVPQVVIPETVYVLQRNGGYRLANRFIETFQEVFDTLVSLETDDMTRIAQLRLQYADANLDFVDCAIIATAERLNITMIATLDTRDFTLVRPAHCDFFEIYP